MPSLELRSVTAVAHGAVVLDHLDVHIADGELLGVVGESGAGKTMLLRVLAGLSPLAGGSITMDGVEIGHLPTAERDVSMVFQRSALFPDRSVRRNVAFPLEVRRVPEEQGRLRVEAEARAVHITALLERPAAQLSAGEAQLVQVARALVRVPSLLLLDEPLAHLDPVSRARMRSELRLLQEGYGVTTVMTTDDPHEALAMPDRLLVLDGGRAVQIDAPMEVYLRPATLSAARLTGPVSTVGGHVVGAGGDGVVLAIRPEGVAIEREGDLPALVAGLEYTGPTTFVHCRVGEELVTATVPPGRAPRVGDAVRLRIRDYDLFDAASGERCSP